MSELPASTHPVVLAVLLDALADSQPAPKPPKWEADAERGLTNRDRIRCPKCAGTGTVTWKKHQHECDRCHGAGFWKGDHYDQRRAVIEAEHAAELDVLTYTRSVLAWLRSDDHAAWKLCRATHSRRGAIRDPADYAAPFTVDGELQREARSRHPAFAILEQALVDLHRAAPAHVAVLEHVHLTKLPIGQQIAIYDDALLLLGDTLGPGFRAPGWARRKADDELRGERLRKANGAGRHALNPTQRARRDDEIRKLAARGDKPAAIGRRLGLDRRTVERILHREEAA